MFYHKVLISIFVKLFIGSIVISISRTLAKQTDTKMANQYSWIGTTVSIRLFTENYYVYLLNYPMLVVYLFTMCQHEKFTFKI